MAPLDPKREAKLRAYVEGRDFPPSDPPGERVVIHQAERDLAREAGVPGFGTAFKHFMAGADRMGKRIAVLIGLAGGFGVVESTVVTYMNSIKSEKQLDAEAKDRSWKQEVSTQLALLNNSMGGVGGKVSKVEDDQRTISNTVGGVVAKEARLEGWASNRGFHP